MLNEGWNPRHSNGLDSRLRDRSGPIQVRPEDHAGDQQQVPRPAQHVDQSDDKESGEDGEDQVRDLDHGPHAPEGHLRHARQAQRSIRAGL